MNTTTLKARKIKTTPIGDSDVSGVDEYGFPVDLRETHYAIRISDTVIYRVTGLRRTTPKFMSQFQVKVDGAWVLAPVIGDLWPEQDWYLKRSIYGAEVWAKQHPNATPDDVFRTVDDYRAECERNADWQEGWNRDLGYEGRWNGLRAEDWRRIATFAAGWLDEVRGVDVDDVVGVPV